MLEFETYNDRECLSSYATNDARLGAVQNV